MRVIESLLSVIAPHDCLSCGSEGSIVCDSCRLEFIVPPPSRCAHCLRMTISYALCKNAKKQLGVEHVWVAGEYSGVAKYLIHSLKYDGVREAAKCVAESLTDLLPELPPGTIVVPVPTATSRVRQRGFDHTLHIARQLSKNRGWVYEMVLARLDQQAQVGAKRTQRISQLNNKMFVPSPKFVKGQSILLIDDVFTTGATLKEAARALRQAGAKRIDAAVFSQKVL